MNRALSRPPRLPRGGPAGWRAGWRTGSPTESTGLAQVRTIVPRHTRLQGQAEAAARTAGRPEVTVPQRGGGGCGEEGGGAASRSVAGGLPAGGVASSAAPDRG
ncbi:MAG: hypothetical protein ACKOJF_32070, partial [Planctomycetaceae bacterium]